MLKYKNGDKFDGYIPNKSHFIHDDYHVSGENEHFHISSGYRRLDNHSRGARFGIDKKMHRISGHGIFVDSYDIGKNDNR